jgi:hypothetical protein
MNAIILNLQSRLNLPSVTGSSFALAGITAICLIIAVWQFPPPSDGNGDAAWLLILAERWLDGARLYVDVLETNPPMSILLYVPPVWLARHTGLPAEIWMYGLVTALAAVSLGATWRLSAPAGLEGRSRIVFLAVAAFALLVMPARCFAEREHIAAISLLPCLMLLVARWNDARPAGGFMPVLAGLGAALAICIKPHFAIMILLAQLAMVGENAIAIVRRGTGWSAIGHALLRASISHLRGGRLIPVELLIAAAIFLAYVASVFRFFPAYFGEMYGRLSLLYLPHKLSWAEFVASEATVLVLAAAVLVWLARPARPSRLFLVLIAAAAGGFVSYAIQFKGWPYHQIPAMTFLALAFTTLNLPSPENASATAAPSATFLKVIIAAMLVLFGILTPKVFSRHDTPRALEAEIRRHGERPTLLIATSNMGISFPLVRRVNGTWAGRSVSLWMSEAASAIAARSTSPYERALLDRMFQLDRREFVEDAIRARPDIIGFAAFDAESDLLPWALREPEMATLLEGYEQTALVDGIRVIVRRDVLGKMQAAGR